jgi:hypothetical protein
MSARVSPQSFGVFLDLPSQAINANIRENLVNRSLRNIRTIENGRYPGREQILSTLTSRTDPNLQIKQLLVNENGLIILRKDGVIIKTGYDNDYNRVSNIYTPGARILNGTNTFSSGFKTSSHLYVSTTNRFVPTPQPTLTPTRTPSPTRTPTPTPTQPPLPIFNNPGALGIGIVRSNNPPIGGGWLLFTTPPSYNIAVSQSGTPSNFDQQFAPDGTRSFWMAPYVYRQNQVQNPGQIQVYSIAYNSDGTSTNTNPNGYFYLFKRNGYTGPVNANRVPTGILLTDLPNRGYIESLNVNNPQNRGLYRNYRWRVDLADSPYSDKVGILYWSVDRTYHLKVYQPTKHYI